MITREKMPWSFIKFSQLILKGNVWRSVWRICKWTLGLKESMLMLSKASVMIFFRVRTGHGKPGKSWNLRILFSWPGKNLIVGPWESWKIKVLFGRLVTAGDKARTSEYRKE